MTSRCSTYAKRAAAAKGRDAGLEQAPAEHDGGLGADEGYGAAASPPPLAHDGTLIEMNDDSRLRDEEACANYSLDNDV